MSTYYTNSYITNAPSGSPPGVYQGGSMPNFPGSPSESGPSYDASPSPTGPGLACPRFPPYSRPEMGVSPPPTLHPSTYYSPEPGFSHKRPENLSIYPENLHRSTQQNDSHRQQQQNRPEYAQSCKLQNHEKESPQSNRNLRTPPSSNDTSNSSNTNNNNSTIDRLADSPPNNSNSDNNTNNNNDKGSADEDFSDHSPHNSTGENSADGGPDGQGGSNVPMYPWMRSQFGESITFNF